MTTRRKKPNVYYEGHMVYTVRKHRQLIVYDTDAIFIMLQSNFLFNQRDIFEFEKNCIASFLTVWGCNQAIIMVPMLHKNQS